MRRQRPVEPRTWMLFAFPAAIAVPIIAGILLAGPAVGFLAAAVVSLVIVAGALRVGRRQGTRRAESWRRAAARRFAVPMVLAAAGVVLVVLASGTLRTVGWGVVAVAITLAISLVFLEIGYSEDRGRARGDEDPMVRSDGSARRLRCPVDASA